MGRQFNLPVANQTGDNPHQVQVEIGTVTFSTTDSQATFRTTLKHVLSGAAVLTGTTSLATDSTTKDWVSIPLGAVTSGAITITRSSAGTSGAKYAITLFGDKVTEAP